MRKVKNTVIYLSSCMLLMLLKVNNVYAAGNNDCETIFGNVNDKNSLIYLIREILGVFRIIAPILVIVLGSLDLFLAMASSSEDKMRKAQSNFIKRIIMGVCLFFVPTIIYFIIDMAGQIDGFDLDVCLFKL